MGKYRVIIEPDEDGVYVVEVPSLPGCISQGRTRAEAINTIKRRMSTASSPISYLRPLQRVV
jgi:predicted RNase H-like HicB family nuclease